MRHAWVINTSHNLQMVHQWITIESHKVTNVSHMGSPTSNASENWKIQKDGFTLFAEDFLL